MTIVVSTLRISAPRQSPASAAFLLPSGWRADRPDAVSDEVWNEAARHYDKSQLAGLVLAIATINAFNRVNAATRQITGEWVEQYIHQPQAA